jgi:O-acetyl-ADP-ribose deacetylase (regulator of RNase III)
VEVRVFAGSVLEAPVEAIVNAANTELRHGGGLAAAIAAAAGPEFERASAAAGFCPLGSAVATPAGRLPFRLVLHVPTIDYRAGGRRASAGEIGSGVAAALRLAVQHGCSSVAFPILGAGVVGHAPEDACRAIAAGLTAAGDPPGLRTVLVCAYREAERRAAVRVFGDGGPAAPGDAAPRG